MASVAHADVEEWMTGYAVRHRLGVTNYRLMKLAADGQLGSRPGPRGYTVFSRSDVERLARERARKHPAKK